MNVMLLHGDQRPFSATRVAICRVVRARMSIQTVQIQNICIPVLTTLKMATRVVETCRWSLCNNITIKNPSAIVGHL